MNWKVPEPKEKSQPAVNYRKYMPTTDEKTTATRLLSYLDYDIRNFRRKYKGKLSNHDMALAFCERWPGYRNKYGPQYIERMLNSIWD